MEGVKKEDNTMCNYCRKTYKTKYTLIRHQKKCSAKLEHETLKNEKNDEIKEIINKYEEQLNELKKLTKNYEKEINDKNTKIEILRTLNKQYMSTIDNLQDRIETLAKEAINKPTMNTNTTNNTTNTHILNLTPIDFEKEDFNSKIDEFYDLDYMMKGIKGVAEFTKKKILTDEDGKTRYICSDPSRMIFKYKDVNGETRKDVKAYKLLSKIRPGFINKATNIVMSMEDELEYNDLVRYQDMALVISTMHDNDKVIGEIAKLS